MAELLYVIRVTIAFSYLSENLNRYISLVVLFKHRERPVVMYGLLTKCEVKMAGYWPSSFFACLWTETKSRSINSQKKTRPISSHLDRTNLVNKGFIICLLGKFCLRDTAGSPERARWLHLARSDSQPQRAIWFILPARGASHIIIGCSKWYQTYFIFSF